MMNQFIDRTKELEFLENIHKENGPQMIIIYGRRRIGKTRLITEFCKNKPSIYLMAVETSIRDNVKYFQSVMAEFLNNDSFSKLNIESFEELFQEFFKWHTKDQIVIVIDEFPYLFHNHPETLSQFQRSWDLNLSKKNITLIISGSSIGMMEQKVLSPKAPLYGRRTGQWNLTHLPLTSLIEFFPNYSFKDILMTYGVLDTIPAYLLKFNPKNSFWTNLENKIMKKGGFLFEEGRILLKQELREISNYVFILESITLGKVRLKKIADYTKLDKGALSRYLYNLERLGIINYELPVGRPKRKKIGIYKLSDNYMHFYFRFIYPNIVAIETENFKIDSIKEQYEQYMGYIFESVIIETLINGGRFSKVGRWWHKAEEIDIFALDERKNELLLGEVKWTNRNVGYDVFEDLKRKSNLIKGFKNYKKRYLLVSRTGFRKNLLEDTENEIEFWDMNKVFEMGLR